MSHYNYFYNFHNKPLAQGLFSQAPEVSAAPPPPGNALLDNDSSNLLNNDGTTLEDN